MQKWTQELNITKEEVVKTFRLAKLSTKDSKLLTFNYKLINRLINNKANLFKWNIGTDPNCTFCDRNLIDDTHHSFMQCDWAHNKIKQILDNLDPLRTWAKLINNKTEISPEDWAYLAFLCQNQTSCNYEYEGQAIDGCEEDYIADYMQIFFTCEPDEGLI